MSIEKNLKPSLMLAVAMFLVLILVPISAQTDEVDGYVRTQIQRQRIPRLSLSVVRNGEVVKTKGYGSANVELTVLATQDTIYQSGSVGKRFTITAVTMLVEEGKVALDDKTQEEYERRLNESSGMASSVMNSLQEAIHPRAAEAVAVQ